jgi:hypothetical protein
MLNKEIADIEKEIEKRNLKNRQKAIELGLEPLDDNGWDDTIELEAKLSTLKSAQQKFNGFVEGCKRCLRNGTIVLGTFYDLVDELSSKPAVEE